MKTPIITALLILLVGILLVYAAFWNSKYSGSGDSPPVNVPPVADSPLSIEELTSNLQNQVDHITTVLENIRDESTAQGSLSTIDEVTLFVISLKLDRLPEAQKGPMVDLVKPMVDQIVKVLKRIYKIPGVQAFIEPAISPMLSRLQAFANVSAD